MKDDTKLHAHGFAPIANKSSQVLIVGSMPGKASLRARQYYAHPRNIFWKIIGNLFDFDPAAPYEIRIAKLLGERIALWDVLESCTRKSSLDSDIDDSTIVPNGFTAFFQEHSAIRGVYFNGAKAEDSYRRYVLAGLSANLDILYYRLPSTSPANAAISYQKKFEAWQIVSRATSRRCS